MKNQMEIGDGSRLAEDLNSIIDNASEWTAEEIRKHAMAIQPSREKQALWDAAPELLEALKELVLDVECYCTEDGDPSIAGGSYYRVNVCAVHRAKEAVAKAEGGAK